MGGIVSKQDANQVLRLAFNDATRSLRTDTTVIATIGTVDVAIDAAGGDTIAISDGTDTMVVNPDGSINANIVLPQYNPIFAYAAVLAVPANVTTSLISYTMPGGKDGYLQKIHLSGENIARYTVRVNGVVIDVARTYFGNDLDKDLDYTAGANNLGYELNAGDVVLVQVLHTRPSLAEFNARLQILENV
jgi:hypothetical protein